ncbi:MAG: type II toxin-antitoxin system RelE/ParE family toxin [Oscillospiraceae bacterium]|nr:type II toxin-antitoxin system RelE/ParE family toxin [Oscillospiraceae bacterium]
MKIKYGKKALKFLSRAEKSVVLNIKESIKGLTKTPPHGDIKPLSGYKDGRKRLRYGSYRVIFRYDENIGETANVIKVLLIMDIGSRGDIYKEG